MFIQIATLKKFFKIYQKNSGRQCTDEIEISLFNLVNKIPENNLHTLLLLYINLLDIFFKSNKIQIAVL